MIGLLGNKDLCDIYYLAGLLGLNELEARYASYIDLANVIRHCFLNPEQELKELYQRLIFNVLIGNTDDHARNYSAFWNGEHLCLTPAYDLLLQFRSGQETSQAMMIDGIQGNLATLTNVLSVADKFLFDKQTAKGLIESQISTIQENWDSLCEEADLPIIEKKRNFGGMLFLTLTVFMGGNSFILNKF